MLLAISTMVRFARSATLFCSGVYGVDGCLSMPCVYKKRQKALDINSPPLSDRNALILCSDCVSASALNSLNFSRHPPFDFIVYNQTLLEKSSMKVTKYLAPPMEVVLMGSHTSECTISKGFVARVPLSFGNSALCCLPYTHPSQNGMDDSSLPRVMPLTMLSRKRTLLTFK